MYSREGSWLRNSSIQTSGAIGPEMNDPRAKSLGTEEWDEALVLVLGCPHGFVDVGKFHKLSQAFYL